jgi:transglutaminase-like putative cysteine protease
VRGWADLDPSNAMMTGNEQIVIAQGRGNAGISPVAGIIVRSRSRMSISRSISC